MKIDKVCLIIPPSLFLLDERVFMTLGLLKVAAVLELKGILVEVLDLSGVRNFTDVVADYVRAKPDINVFGLTATTPQLPAAVKIASAIRTERKSAKIILGGPHVTLVNGAYKKEQNNGITGRAVMAMDQMKEKFDVLVVGDGEKAVFEALSLDSQKIIDADNINSSLFLKNNNLNELPFPARHLVDHNSYHYYIDGERAISLIAQLGCPFGCGFCGGRDTDSFRRIRTRTSQNIVDEMVFLYLSWGYKGFMLYDDELNVNKGMIELMLLIAQTQKRLGVEWRLRGFIKSQLFTDEQAEAMYQAGFRWILVGFESGSPFILDVINKKATVEDNTRCMEIARRHKLKVKALMSVGHPGETRQTILDTKNWLLKVKPDDFDLTVINCYPGTPYYDQAVPDRNQSGVWVYTHKTGAKLYQVGLDYFLDAGYYKGIPGKYKSFVYTDELQSEGIVKLRDDLEIAVRHELKIPFNHGAPGVLYEHSMGQSGFPQNILRVSR